MQDLKVTLIQSELYWENPSANYSMFEEKIWSIEEDTDLIVLPEMFNTGFSMEAEKLAEPMNLHACKWLKQVASQKKAHITGSVIINDSGKYYNRLLWVSPEGEIQHYDKKHLFTFAEEDKHFSPGKDKIFPEIKGWRILPLICYDLRFPVYSRNDAQNPFDLLLYVANWPAVRVSAWSALLKARAIENASYSLGVNRVGEDGKGLKYNGQSAVYDFKGDELAHLGENEGIETILFSAEKLSAYRKKFPVLNDADSFKLT